MKYLFKDRNPLKLLSKTLGCLKKWQIQKFKKVSEFLVFKKFLQGHYNLKHISINMFNFWISSTKKHWVFERDFKKQEFLVLEKFSLKYSRAYKILFKRLEYFKNIFFLFFKS